MRLRSSIQEELLRIALLIVPFGVGVFGASPASGQERGSGRQIFSQSRARPPTFAEPSADLALPTFVPVDDEDLGTLRILQESPKYKPLSIAVSSGLYYTDNAGLDSADEIEDGYWWSTVGAAYLPQIKGALTGDFSVSYETFRYESESDLDFDELEVGAGLVYVFRRMGDLTVYGRYNYDRITEPRDYTEIYVQHGIVTGFYKPFVINRKNFCYVRGNVEFGLDTNPSAAKQNDYNVLLGYRLAVTDDLSVEPYYRARYLNFVNGREDLSHTVGLGVNYQLSKSWYAGLSGYYITNDSNHEFGDFEAGTAGGRLGLFVRF